MSAPPRTTDSTVSLSAHERTVLLPTTNVFILKNEKQYPLCTLTGALYNLNF